MIAERHPFILPILTLLEAPKPDYVCPVDSESPENSEFCQLLDVERGGKWIEVSVPIDRQEHSYRRFYRAQDKAWIVGSKDGDWLELTTREQADAVTAFLDY